MTRSDIENELGISQSMGEPSEQILHGRRIRMVAVEPFGCLQAFLGLALGGLTAFILIGIDPFGVTAFELRRDSTTPGCRPPMTDGGTALALSSGSW